MRLALARLCHASDLDSSVVAPRGKDQRRYPHMIAHRAAGRCSFFVLVSLPEGCKASARLEDLRLAGFINGCQTGFGWTAGAGIEAAFTDNLTARIEYLFVDLATPPAIRRSIAGSTRPTPVANDTVKFSSSIIRLGVDYKLR